VPRKRTDEVRGLPMMSHARKPSSEDLLPRRKANIRGLIGYELELGWRAGLREIATTNGVARLKSFSFSGT
jgi:hypothetical protein